jgi:hypothetical protein
VNDQACQVTPTCWIRNVEHNVRDYLLVCLKELQVAFWLVLNLLCTISSEVAQFFLLRYMIDDRVLFALRLAGRKLLAVFGLIGHKVLRRPWMAKQAARQLRTRLGHPRSFSCSRYSVHTKYILQRAGLPC